MNILEKENLQTFKFSVISPLVCGLVKDVSKSTFFRMQAENTFEFEGSQVKLSARTIKAWYYEYVNGGLKALTPSTRSDVGKKKKMNDIVEEQIKHYVETYPDIPVTKMYNKIMAVYPELKTSMSLRTLQRYVKDHKKLEQVGNKRTVLRYEAESVNDIWCCDTTYVFKTKSGNKSRQLYAIIIIDDASRYIVGYGLFYQDNYANFMSVLKSAIKEHGKPKLLNLDNGSPYKNKQLEGLAARLEIQLFHNRAYYP